jgi:hypothetical protein
VQGKKVVSFSLAAARRVSRPGVTKSDKRLSIDNVFISSSEPTLTTDSDRAEDMFDQGTAVVQQRIAT